MRNITLYNFNELNPKAQEKAEERYAKFASIGVLLARKILSNTENYNFEFLEDGTLVSVLKG